MDFRIGRALIVRGQKQSVGSATKTNRPIK